MRIIKNNRIFGIFQKYGTEAFRHMNEDDFFYFSSLEGFDHIKISKNQIVIYDIGSKVRDNSFIVRKAD